MKEHYSSPYISVEDLEKTDILLASPPGGSDPSEASEPAAQELENAYRDITSFFFSGDWFS